MHHLLHNALVLLAQQAPAEGVLAGLNWPWLVVRVFHLSSAAALVGGAFYLRFVLLPAVERHQSADAKRLLEDSRKRWAMLAAGSALVLLASGFYSFIVTISKYEAPKPYHMLFGIKFLLAMGVFFLASVLGGRTALAERFRQNAQRWLSIIVWLSLAIIVLASMLRFIEKPDKTPQLAPARQAAG